MGQGGWVDAFAVVFDFECDGFRPTGQARFDQGAGRAVLEGVEEEIGEEQGAVFRGDGDEETVCFRG